MKRFFLIAFAAISVFLTSVFAQIPTSTLVEIVKAEDERRFDLKLQSLLNSSDTKVRKRAALAIGRIGNDAAIPALIGHLHDDPEVIAMVLFALGEIESTKAASEILEILENTKQSSDIRARAVEAAGKIAAANPKDENSKKLGLAIVKSLNFGNSRRSAPPEDIVLLGLTAVLRAKPEGGEKIVAEFLRDSNPRIRADALNTLARLRSKSVSEKARELSAKDTDPIVRANAARISGVGEDKEALDLLLNAALTDKDSRVRVSAIRALGNLKDAKIANDLIVSGENLSRKFASNKSELREIATTLGRLLPNTDNQKAIEFLERIRELDKYESPETEIAFALISPKGYLKAVPHSNSTDRNFWRQALAASEGFAQFAKLEDKGKSFSEKESPEFLLSMFLKTATASKEELLKASPDILRAYSQFKTNDLGETLLQNLKHPDVQLRATAAGLLADQPTSTENVEALKTAFNYALLSDKHDNDAQLAILDALFKLDTKESVGNLLIALNATDYLVRKKAFELLKTEGLDKDYPGLPSSLENAMAKKKNQVLPYSPVFRTKLGQVLNTNADYLRAVSRKNGTVKAVLTTSKGTFSIIFFPEDAPLTVDNFIKLAKSNYFNGLTVHRVVANFVMQDGDPRGDGNGGPGWSIRCEVNMLPYGRGAVGMALSGKDTGGSQWFATHSPQPHLDGGYTVFGQVSETGMKIVDAIARGDKILNVKIVGDSLQKNVRQNK